jgi:hypothetical protein
MVNIPATPKTARIVFVIVFIFGPFIINFIISHFYNIKDSIMLSLDTVFEPVVFFESFYCLICLCVLISNYNYEKKGFYNSRLGRESE